MKIHAELLACPACAEIAAYRLADRFAVFTCHGWEGAMQGGVAGEANRATSAVEHLGSGSKKNKTG